MNRQKKFFNLVEVVLALGVAGLGIAGVMAVIPVALNAAKTADNENAAADSISTFFATWDTLLKQSDDVDNKGKVSKEYGWSIILKNYLKSKKMSDEDISKLKQEAPFEKPDRKDKGFDILSHTKSGGFKSIVYDSDSDLSEDGLYRIWLGTPSEEKIYPDFAADFVVWREPHSVVVWEEKDNGEYEPTACQTPDSNDPAIVRVYIEMSWPVTVDYEKREKRLFVRDYYNPNIANGK